MSKKSIQTWQDNFGVEPVKIIPETNKLQNAWAEMGVAFGRIQLEKQKYVRAGLTESANEIEKKLVEKKKDLEERTIDLMGYSRLKPNVKTLLSETARSENLHLNVYALEEYKKIPPSNVAMAIMEARQYFVRIEIWAIEEQAYVRPMKDPAVIGYVKIGYAEVPYLIATWGDDILPEDLANIEQSN